MATHLTLIQCDALDRLRQWRPAARASDEHLLVGTREWVERKERAADAKGKKYSETAVLKNIFLFVEEYEPESVNGRNEMATGKVLHHAFVNFLEVTAAANRLSEKQRTAWMLFVSDYSYREIAERMDVRWDDARKLISLAKNNLVEMIWDRVDTTLSGM